MLYSKNSTPRIRHSTSPQQIDNSTNDPQQKNNDSLGSETNKSKLALPWFRKPPWSNKGQDHVRTQFKEGRIKLIGSGFIFFHSLTLPIYSALDLGFGEKNNMTDYCVDGSFAATGFAYLFQYLDNFELLLSSKFEIGEKGCFGYFGDPVLKEFVFNGLQIARQVYQFMNSRQHIAIFVFGILGVIICPIGNAMLIEGKGKKKLALTADDSEVDGSIVNDLTVNDSTFNDLTANDSTVNGLDPASIHTFP